MAGDVVNAVESAACDLASFVVNNSQTLATVVATAVAVIGQVALAAIGVGPLADVAMVAGASGELAAAAGAGAGIEAITDVAVSGAQEGNAAGETVFSGHGAFVEGSGEVTVPEGASVSTYAFHDSYITDATGN